MITPPAVSVLRCLLQYLRAFVVLSFGSTVRTPAKGSVAIGGPVVVGSPGHTFLALDTLHAQTKTTSSLQHEPVPCGFQ